MFNLCKEYDERQQIIRGSICKHIMVIMGICVLINGIIEDAGFVWPDKFIARFSLWSFLVWWPWPMWFSSSATTSPFLPQVLSPITVNMRFWPSVF